MYDKSIKGPIIYIRHAQSLHNKAALKYTAEEFPEKWSKELQDASITDDVAMDQIKELIPTVLDMTFTYVFVSPLNRCIETLYHSLKTHPNFDKMIIYIHPLLHEQVCSSCDLSMKIDEKEKKYSYIKNLNFKYFHENVNNEFKDYYFLDFFNFDKSQLKENKYEENIEKILEHMKLDFSQSGEGTEDLSSIYKRTVKFKEFLKEFKSLNKIADDEKILVYTHSRFIQLSTSKMASRLTNLDNLTDSYFPKNCEAVTIHLD